MNCSVVVPVYRSGQTLHLLVERLAAVLPRVAENYELVLVNDGSPDDSWEVIQSLAKRHAWVRGVNLMRNYGQHNATLCGIRAARHEVIVVMDDDLQNPPEEIPKLLAKLNEGYDVVYGVSRKRQQAWYKSLVSALLKRAISYVMGQQAVRDIGAFKAFRADLRKSFDSFHGPAVLVDVLLSWGTDRFASVTVEEAPRAAGKSNYNFVKLIKVSLLVLTSYTTVPLRLASILGFLFTFFGFFVLVYVLVTYLAFGSVEGFPFLASIIVIFSGVQLFALGIIGEYLARLFDRSSGRKTYTVGATTEEKDE
ncbi:MAG: glycosyltransferase family 2 protein [Chloroflexi bacterium]|nr:glycosyltransferase family 2 protein [Chloroflexota bacterium]